MGSIINFFKKIGYVIKHAPFLTCVTITSIVLTCVTIIQVGPENIPGTWKTTPVFGLMLDPDYPDIEADSIDFAGKILVNQVLIALQFGRRIPPDALVMIGRN